MNVKDIVIMVSSIIVAILVISAVMVPIVSTAIDDQYVVYNNANGQYSSIVGDSLEISYTFDSENKTYEYIANGENVTLRAGQDVVFITDACLFKMGVINNPSNYIVYYDGSSHIVYNIKSLTVSVSGSTSSLNWVTSADTNGSAELDYSWGFYATSVGDHRAIIGSETIYYHDIDDIYGSYWYSTGSAFVTYNGENAIYNGNPATIEYNSSPVNEVIDVYSTTLNESSLTGIVVSYNDVDFGSNVAIVPDKVVGDKAYYSDTVSLLLSILPILVVVGLLGAIVFYFRRT